MEASSDDEREIPPGAQAISSHVAGSVCKVLVREGERVTTGQTVVLVESIFLLE